MTTNSATSVPRLENGDRLTRSEFERRYAAMPDIKKAELIEGVVYVASPLRFRNHAQPHGWLILWLGTYAVATPGVAFGDAPTVLLDLDNEPQPDAVLFINENAGGNCRITEDDYIEGAPELIVEIAASTASYDMNDKLRAYRRNGVQEYIVWQIYENRLNWFSLRDSEYVLLQPDSNGNIQSQVFSGLWLAVEALLNGDLVTVLTQLQNGLATPEHQEFVKRLL